MSFFNSSVRYRDHVESGANALFGSAPTVQHGNPLESITPQQKQKMQEFRSLIDQEWDVASLLCARDAKYDFLNDLTLYRFLSGFKWDIKVCAPLLKKTCEWRRDYKPWLVRFEDVQAELIESNGGVVWHHGHTREGHPIIYMRLAADKSDKSDPKVMEMMWKLFVWLNELTCARMPENVYQIFWIVDIKDASLSIPLVSNMKDLFIQLGEYYVEGMVKLYVLNTHWTVSLVWNFLKPFLTAATVEKYDIRRPMNLNDIQSLLEKDIDHDVISDLLGGGNPYRIKADKIVQWDRERLKQIEEEEEELEKNKPPPNKVH